MASVSVLGEHCGRTRVPALIPTNAVRRKIITAVALVTFALVWGSVHFHGVTRRSARGFEAAPDAAPRSIQTRGSEGSGLRERSAHPEVSQVPQVPAPQTQADEESAPAPSSGPTPSDVDSAVLELVALLSSGADRMDIDAASVRLEESLALASQHELESLLRTILREPRADVRAWLVISLGRRKDAFVTSFLADLITRDPDATVRSWGVYSLVRNRQETDESADRAMIAGLLSVLAEHGTASPWLPEPGLPANSACSLAFGSQNLASMERPTPIGPVPEPLQELLIRRLLAEEEPGVLRALLEVLSRCKASDRCDQALLKFVEGSAAVPLRAHALLSLRDHTSQETAKWLMTMVADEDRETALRGAAAMALATNGSQGTTEWLQSLASRSPDPALRIDIVNALARSHGMGGVEAVLPVLAGERDEQVLIQGVLAVMNHGTSALSDRVLAVVTSSGSSIVRGAFIRSLNTSRFAGVQSAALSDLLLQTLRGDSEPELRAEAASLLGASADAGIRAALATAKLSDPDESVRAAAAQALDTGSNAPKDPK